MFPANHRNQAIMGRIWKKKTNRIRVTESQVQLAIEQINKGVSIRSAAEQFDISK